MEKMMHDYSTDLEMLVRVHEGTNFLVREIGQETDMSTRLMLIDLLRFVSMKLQDDLMSLNEEMYSNGKTKES